MPTIYGKLPYRSRALQSFNFRFQSLDPPPHVARPRHAARFGIYRHRAEVEDGVRDGIGACGDQNRLQNQRTARAGNNRVGVSRKKPKGKGHWGPAGTLAAAEKAAITSACERLLTDVLTPRYLPEVRPSNFNYPIRLEGRWHGNNYRFIIRYKANLPGADVGEFDAPFARLEYVSRDRFDISWFRHTEQWFKLHRGVTLAEAMQILATDSVLAPIV